MVLTPSEVVVAHASGMVSVQASCSIEEALGLIATRADEIGATVQDVATAVVDRLIGFHPSPN